MSTLSSYLVDADISVNEFGRKLGVSAGVVSRYMTGQRRPSIEIALRIAAETGGKVPVESWAKPRPPRRASRS
jgi:transcriptional regulator with XRE-family HTH domain